MAQILRPVFDDNSLAVAEFAEREKMPPLKEKTKKQNGRIQRQIVLHLLKCFHPQ